jgi:hypothetical protein
MNDVELTAEALRLYRRYAVEIVEAFALCPWAERARRDGQVTERVLCQRGQDTGPALSSVLELARSPRIEVGLLIFPRLAVDALTFEHFTAKLRDQDAERHELGAIPFAMAAFHPDADADLSDAERLIPFLRRTPDPTIQLVRRSVLDRVRGKSPQGTSFADLDALEALEATATGAAAGDQATLRERIARKNHETVRAAGVAALRARLDDIGRDRAASYARLGA